MELVTSWDVKDLINGIIEDRGTAEPHKQENDQDSYGDSYLTSAEWRVLDAKLASAVRTGQAARDDLRDIADGTLPRPKWMTPARGWPAAQLDLFDLADTVSATAVFIDALMEARA